jgi:lipid-A-disaccharide synthase
LDRIFFVAGEASGDALGARLIENLKSRNPFLQCEGIGGPLMEEAGHFSSFVPFPDLGVMGIDIVKSLPLLIQHFRKTKAYLRHSPPSVLVTIDTPEFSCRLARSLSDLPIGKIHCVAPSVWAWRPKRARKMAIFFDHLLTLFPFEAPYFEREGLNTTFVGHPLADKPRGDTGFFWRRYPELSPEKPLLILLPGSRRAEIQKLLPLFLETSDRLRETIPHLQFVLVTLPSLLPLIHDILSSCSVPLHIVADRSLHSAVFAAGTAALAASGTITLEIALEETPLVGAYHVSWLLEKFLERMLQTPWVTLPNILLKEGIVPECLQKACNPSMLYEKLYPLLRKEKPWSFQKKAFSRIRPLLKNEKTFGESAADVVRAFL